MSCTRRALLGGSAGIATALAGAPAMAALHVSAAEFGPPMPPPSDALPPPLPESDPSRTCFDLGWRFHEGEVPAAAPVTHNDTYLSVKAGTAPGAAAPDFDDSDWQQVTLPHDWASFQPVVETANVSQGYRKRGIGWYRRAFRLDEADRGKRLEVQFGAIATNATIWINGNVVAHSWSGYTGIYIDITPFARFGDALNVIAVRVDATVMEGWWYEGAGIYRHAWLARRPAVSIATDGIHASPVRGEDGQWLLPVSVMLESVAPDAAEAMVEAVLRTPEGREIAQARAGARIAPLERGETRLTLAAGRPSLWSLEDPALHILEVRVIRPGAPADERRLAIGFRTIAFDPDLGVSLNGRHLKLKGVCLHQDHAGVGVAVPDTLLAWRLARLKDMGCNAIRCSHNACAAELLDLADRMGFLVMAENRQFNPAPDYLAQLEWMIRRDRNHPSVMLWSVFNEEPMQGTHAGVQMVRRMVAAVRRLDPHRPTTAAMNGAFYDPENVSQVVDVMGFNYYPNDYDRYHRLNPGKPILSSEDTSAMMTRGAFASDPAAHVLSSLDTEAADWGATHRRSWAEIAARPFVAGGFVWTGFDYHGEPTPFAWPTTSSFFGILDLCGFPKTAYDIRRAQWRDDIPVVAIAPHWTWPGREGQPLKLLVTSNADSVELRLNGRTIGEARVDRINGNEWTLPYAPGRIEAIARRGGREVAHAVHETVGEPVALRLTPARRKMAADGEDVQPFTLDAVDRLGRHVPDADCLAHFTVRGGTIIGVGNGDPNSHASEKAPSRALFHGLAQVLVRADPGTGPLLVRAAGASLRATMATVEKMARAPRPQVAVEEQLQSIAAWRRSPLLSGRPDPALAPRDGDNNAWAFVSPGDRTPADAGAGWRVYRANVMPRRAVRRAGGTLRFAAIAGQAEIWVDGNLAATKPAPAPGPVAMAWPAGDGPQTVALLVRFEPGQTSGLAGAVTITEGKGTEGKGTEDKGKR